MVVCIFVLFVVFGIYWDVGFDFFDSVVCWYVVWSIGGWGDELVLFEGGYVGVDGVEVDIGVIGYVGWVLVYEVVVGEFGVCGS